MEVGTIDDVPRLVRAEEVFTERRCLLVKGRHVSKQQDDLSACNTEEDGTGRALALYQGGRLRGDKEPQPIRRCSWRRTLMMVGRPGLHQPGSCCSGMEQLSM